MNAPFLLIPPALRRKLVSALAATLALALACGPSVQTTPVVEPAKPAAEAPKPADKPQERATPASPGLRLPKQVTVKHHTVELTLDPSLEEFSGAIAIELDLVEATDTLWLHGVELTVEQASLEVGGRRLPAVVKQVGDDQLAFMLAEAAPAGPALLRAVYRGKMHKDDGDGIYPVKEGDDWYLFTQFEATDARSAFPCFDEPSYKAPWQLTIRTKAELTAVANTPVEAESQDGDGWKTVRFARTKPLPSYLVAFAIGPFDIVDLGASKSGIAIRVIAPRGQGDKTRWLAPHTAPVLDAMEAYFGMPYPFEKLDLVAVPVFNAGAMENPGLVTYRQSILVNKDAEVTDSSLERYVSVTAHELAHQWFGNYVTLAFWDDTWLNESFASWMGDKITAELHPEWDYEVGLVSSRSRVMGQDSLESARAIRQPIKNKGDIDHAFDGITYGKGQVVLAMLEQWIGPETFKKGVRYYLAEHAWGNADYDDFVSAIAAAAGQEVRGPFDSFVLQSGVPLLAFELSCAKGAPPTLSITQQRYAPVGSKIDTQGRTWQVPVCVKYGVGKQVGRDCTLVTAATATLPLSATKCPDWVLPNEGGAGYYRMLPRGDLLGRLLKKAGKSLTLPERIGLLGDLGALVSSGDVPSDTTLSLVDSFAKDESPYLVSASAGIVGGIDEMVPESLRPNYQRFVLRLYGKRAKALGWKPKDGESDELRSLRPRLLRLVALVGGDKSLVAEATKLCWKWLDDRTAVHPDLVGTVLDIATHYGDKRLFDRLHADAAAAKDRQERGRLIGALAGFSDPQLVQEARRIGLSGEFDLRESFGLVFAGFDDPRTRAAAYAFVKEHFDEIAEKLPPAYRRYMAFAFMAMCAEADEAMVAEIDAFFRPRMEKIDGGAQTMDQAMERLELCVANRELLQPGVVAFLKKQ